MADIRIGIDVNDGGSTAKVNKNAEQLKNTLKDAVIFDGRNLYQPKLLKRLGITYYGIGISNSMA